MLYDLQYVNGHAVYRLNEAIGEFLDQGINRVTFNPHCYPAWFAPVVTASPGLRGHMRKVFRLARRQSQADRDAVLLAWRETDKVQQLCEITRTQFSTCAHIDATFFAALKDLFNFLYDETLESASFGNAIHSSLRDHYETFVNMGQRVCPFCGLKYYEEPQSGSRSSYDHFLPRKNYPLGAVNFRNLIPMCDRCNEPPGKGTKDVLFSNASRTRRRRFFYPFGTNGGVNLATECTQRPKPGDLGAWEVTITPKDISKSAQVRGWVDVFGIKARFPASIRSGIEDWVKEFLNTKQYQNRPSVWNLRRAFAAKADWLAESEQIKRIVEAALKAAAFRYLAEEAPDDMVDGYAAMAISPAVRGIPRALR